MQPLGAGHRGSAGKENNKTYISIRNTPCISKHKRQSRGHALHTSHTPNRHDMNPELVSMWEKTINHISYSSRLKAEPKLST